MRSPESEADGQHRACWAGAAFTWLHSAEEPGSPLPPGTAPHTVSVHAATAQGPLQLVQERYESMTNICNLKIGQSFAII